MPPEVLILSAHVVSLTVARLIQSWILTRIAAKGCVLDSFLIKMRECDLACRDE
jgi:hypothetical protein